jgi:hypothetical protein
MKTPKYSVMLLLMSELVNSFTIKSNSDTLNATVNTWL